MPVNWPKDGLGLPEIVPDAESVVKMPSSWPDDLADLLPTADGGVMIRKEADKPSYTCLANELETCRKALADLLFAIDGGFSGDTWAGVRDGARTAHDRAQDIALAALSKPQGELPKPVHPKTPRPML